MKSRYGLWILSICCIGLAGCSNWQNRVNNGGPGTAASLSAAPAGSASPMLSAPGTSLGEPPPPVPPPPAAGLGMPSGPAGNPAPQRLDLSAAEPPPPAQMYNLESSKAPARPRQSASSGSSAGNSSTISKLASKAKPASSAPAPKPAGSTIDRLSAKSQVSSSGSSAQDEPLPKPAAATEKAATPSQSEPAGTVDTTFLAQPVRKGASSDSDNSKGPQSSLIPSDNKLLYGKSKPAIYPVSNPAVEEPIDITRFS